MIITPSSDDYIIASFVDNDVVNNFLRYVTAPLIVWLGWIHVPFKSRGFFGAKRLILVRCRGKLR